MDLEVRGHSRLRRTANAVRGQKKIVAIIVTFVVLISSMVAYNAWGLAQESDTPLVISVTSRQRSYVESYIKDVLLKVDGEQADPDEDRHAMEMAADALLRGGNAPSPAGSIDDLVTVPKPASAAIRVKLAHERDLIHQVVDMGNTLLLVGRQSPSFEPTLFLMRLTGAQLSSVTGDVAAEEARVARNSLTGLVRVEIALGLLGAFLAVGMGLLLWGAARKQSARFKSLVHNSLDLITVVDDHSIAIYQSPSSSRVLGYAPSDVIGTRVTDLLHPNDKARVIKARPSRSRSGCVTGTARG
jgi:PAS domain-containing protein